MIYLVFEISKAACVMSGVDRPLVFLPKYFIRCQTCIAFRNYQCAPGLSPSAELSNMGITALRKRKKSVHKPEENCNPMV